MDTNFAEIAYSIGALEYLVNTHVKNSKAKERMLEAVKKISVANSIVHCPICNKKVTDFDEKMFTEETGRCLGCDHVEADVMAERSLQDVLE